MNSLVCNGALQISQVGAPVRHLHLRDLLLPAGKIGSVLQYVKLAVFPNAFTLTDELKAAIANLRSQHRTREVPFLFKLHWLALVLGCKFEIVFVYMFAVLFYFAPNALNASGGFSSSGEEVGAFIGCPMVRGNGSHSFVAEFVPPVRSTAYSKGANRGGCADFGSLAGQHYEPTVSGQPGPSNGPSGVLEPYYLLDESTGRHSSANGCQVFARYATVGASTSSATISLTAPAAGVCSVKTNHTVMFSASPLPPEALRRIAVAAGVHLYLNTTVGAKTEPKGLLTTTCTGDGVESSGNGIFVRAGHQATVGRPRKVTLPASENGWHVVDEHGVVMCGGCHGFETALDAGESAAFVVTQQ